MNRWTIRLRNLARKMGIARLRSWRAERAAEGFRREYRANRPATVRIGESAWAGDFLAADEEEYINLREKRSDMEILRTVVNTLKAGDCCWDVGANIGVYTVVAARAVGPSGSVVAFEPEPQSRARMLENVAHNQLRNVRIEPIALSDKPSVLTMALSRSASIGGHRIISSGESTDSGRAIQIDAIPGDQARVERQLPVPSMIKVDVEGAELEVLHGLQATLADPRCKFVLCEVHFAILQSRGRGEVPLEMTRFLETCGFSRTWWIDQSHLVASKGN